MAKNKTALNKWEARLAQVSSERVDQQRFIKEFWEFYRNYRAYEKESEVSAVFDTPEMIALFAIYRRERSQ